MIYTKIYYPTLLALLGCSTWLLPKATKEIVRTSKHSMKKSPTPSYSFFAPSKKQDHLYMPEIKKTMERYVTPFYGDQKDKLKEIEERKDRAYSVLAYHNRPVGFVVYKNNLTGKYERYGLKETFEVKTFSLLRPEENSNKGHGSELLRRVVGLAENRKANQLVLTVSEKKSKACHFFKKKGFLKIHTWYDRYMKESEEYLLSCPLKKRVHKEPNKNAHSLITQKRTRPVGNHSSFFPKNKRRRLHKNNPGGEKSVTLKKKYVETLKKKYVEQILSREKTIEGRINSGRFRDWKKGDWVTFFSEDIQVSCRIERVDHYTSFTQMLEQIDIPSCLPGISNQQKAIQIYHKIPGYRARAKKHGVLAIHLSLA